MKKLSTITVAMVLAAFFVNAQKMDASKVPAAVKAGFSKQYPGVTAKWEKEIGKYEANFKQNGNTMSALFEANGTMIESEMDIAVSALPAAVLAYVKVHYKGKSIKEGAKITKADGTVNYEAEVNGKDVIFDAGGKFLKEAKD
jgi:Putative beta-lactamase-inhibitor-like, PepSY-like